ncbi:hypothetical protein SAMN05519105_1307 [Rhodobacter sp. 24-YEA-8]|nr:hypothetical protein SAMN05519105_1307 [Rhodobacter sp. 24-YEA-8]
MVRNKKAAIATCARAALSSLKNKLNREIVNTNNNRNLEAIWCSGKMASLRRQNCPWERNGAPHSLSAPVGQGRRQAEGDCGRLMFKQVVTKLVPIRAIQKKPGRSSAPRQSYRQFNRQVTGQCDGLMRQRVVGGLVPTSTCCEQGDEA